MRYTLCTVKDASSTEPSAEYGLARASRSCAFLSVLFLCAAATQGCAGSESDSDDAPHDDSLPKACGQDVYVLDEQDRFVIGADGTEYEGSAIEAASDFLAVRHIEIGEDGYWAEGVVDIHSVQDGALLGSTSGEAYTYGASIAHFDHLERSVLAIGDPQHEYTDYAMGRVVAIDVESVVEGASHNDSVLVEVVGNSDWSGLGERTSAGQGPLGPLIATSMSKRTDGGYPITSSVAVIDVALVQDALVGSGTATTMDSAGVSMYIRSDARGDAGTDVLLADLDGDGLSDLCVGDSFFGETYGAVYVVLSPGGAGGEHDLRSCDFYGLGDWVCGSFGRRLGAFDNDQDGYQQLVVSECGYGSDCGEPGAGPGAIHVLDNLSISSGKPAMLEDQARILGDDGEYLGYDLEGYWRGQDQGLAVTMEARNYGSHRSGVYLVETGAEGTMPVGDTCGTLILDDSAIGSGGAYLLTWSQEGGALFLGDSVLEIMDDEGGHANGVVYGYGL